MNKEKHMQVTGVWQKWRFSAPQTHLWSIKVWFSASTFVVKIATFAKRQNVSWHFIGDMLQIQIIDNDKGRHKDLIFSIDALVDNLAFDTYYFAIAIEPYESQQDIENAVATLLNYWLTEIQNAKTGQPIYLPIDFSDQYTGCLKVLKLGDTLQLTYGLSNREGYSVNPLEPGKYSTTITDFEDTANKTIEVSQAGFLNSAEHQIDKLKDHHSS